MVNFLKAGEGHLSTESMKVSFTDILIDCLKMLLASFFAYSQNFHEGMSDNLNLSFGPIMAIFIIIIALLSMVKGVLGDRQNQVATMCLNSCSLIKTI